MNIMRTTKQYCPAISKNSLAASLPWLFTQETSKPTLSDEFKNMGTGVGSLRNSGSFMGAASRWRPKKSTMVAGLAFAFPPLGISLIAAGAVSLLTGCTFNMAGTRLSEGGPWQTTCTEEPPPDLFERREAMLRDCESVGGVYRSRLTKTPCDGGGYRWGLKQSCSQLTISIDGYY